MPDEFWILPYAYHSIFHRSGRLSHIFAIWWPIGGWHFNFPSKFNSAPPTHHMLPLERYETCWYVYYPELRHNVRPVPLAPWYAYEHGSIETTSTTLEKYGPLRLVNVGERNLHLNSCEYRSVILAFYNRIRAIETPWIVQPNSKLISLDIIGFEGHHFCVENMCLIWLFYNSMHKCQSNVRVWVCGCVLDCWTPKSNPVPRAVPGDFMGRRVAVLD